MRFSKGFWAIAVVILILIIDQALKIWIKTHLTLDQSIHIANWFQIRFVENNGMAMGIEILDKFFLSLFRIIASGAIAYYIYWLIKHKISMGYIVCMCMILAGALGNIIDCIFYGVIFNESTPVHLATLFPPEGGYSSWLHGKVVDMFYFPLIDTTWPEWVPFFGGKELVFFRYIFNIADASISVGIGILLLFYRKTLSGTLEKKKAVEN